MNKNVKKFLLIADKFIPELHLKRPRFMYSACGPFNKHCERFRNSEKQVIQSIYLEMN